MHPRLPVHHHLSSRRLLLLLHLPLLREFIRPLLRRGISAPLLRKLVRPPRVFHSTHLFKLVHPSITHTINHLSLLSHLSLCKFVRPLVPITPNHSSLLFSLARKLPSPVLLLMSHLHLHHRCRGHRTNFIPLPHHHHFSLPLFYHRVSFPLPRVIHALLLLLLHQLSLALSSQRLWCNLSRHDVRPRSLSLLPFCSPVPAAAAESRCSSSLSLLVCRPSLLSVDQRLARPSVSLHLFFPNGLVPDAVAEEDFICQTHDWILRRGRSVVVVRSASVRSEEEIAEGRTAVGGAVASGHVFFFARVRDEKC